MAKEQPKYKPERKKSFSVGPANLPDGTYRRKVVKIKRSLIHKAKVKISFSKAIAKDESCTGIHAAQAKKYLEEAAAQENREEERARLRKAAEDTREVGRNSEPKAPKMHPQRQVALEAPAPMEEAEDPQGGNHRSRRPSKKPKAPSFKREEEYAAKVRTEREANIREAKQRRKAHKQKEKERQRRKNVMGARTGKGQQKLGKQGLILLDKVKAMMSRS